MASINGRYVQLNHLPEKPVGVAMNWRPESDWMKVQLLDGSHKMVHCTDRVEVLPADYQPHQ